MEQVAIIVGGIVGATCLLIGISIGEPYLVPALNNIPDTWDLMAAIGTMMMVLLPVFAMWIRRENVNLLRIGPSKDQKG